ncbi:hypothetical protein QUF49_02115 [Fictibacillus sp. b24]|uniref:hypothetical protein n=1 Tax=Fictibacillus sp. b24 TaxID=3055863 RepID=UPI0025A2F196|nr:hypothetical protein [Fictibacillus sp. b24]MDM5314768.1 hypothetical protein [Fictibacillus sp. b24]
MSKTFLAKIGASLMAIFLITACNNAEDTNTEEETNTEQSETQDGETSTDEESTEESAE